MFGKKRDQSFYDRLLENASGVSCRVLLPESTDPRVLSAAAMAAVKGVGQVVLLGSSERFSGVLSRSVLKKIQFLDPNSKELQLKYASKLVELRGAKGVTAEMARSMVLQPMYFACLALKCGDVDGVVAGAVTHTADVLRPAFQIIKTAEGQSVASSCMILECANKQIGEDGVIVMGDCGVVEEPSAEQLADIAVQSAGTAKAIAGFSTPRVALLSYSTKATGESVPQGVQKVKDAFLLVRRKNSQLVVDGELQVDAALVPEVAKAKNPHGNIKGNANVLIMPDLNAGNISYKLAARVSGAKSIGPIVQGLALPVNDVSRGATAEEILGAVAVTVLQARAIKKSNK